MVEQSLNNLSIIPLKKWPEEFVLDWSLGEMRCLIGRDGSATWGFTMELVSNVLVNFVKANNELLGNQFRDLVRHRPKNGVFKKPLVFCFTSARIVEADKITKVQRKYGEEIFICTSEYKSNENLMPVEYSFCAKDRLLKFLEYLSKNEWSDLSVYEGSLHGGYFFSGFHIWEKAIVLICYGKVLNYSASKIYSDIEYLYSKVEGLNLKADENYIGEFLLRSV